MVLWRTRAAPSEPTSDAVNAAAAMSSSSGMAHNNDANDHDRDDTTASPEGTDSEEGGNMVMDMAALDEAAASLGSASEFCARNGLTDCGPASTSMPYDDYDGVVGGLPHQHRHQDGGLGGEMMAAFDDGGGFSDDGGAPPLFPSLSTAGIGGHLQPPMPMSGYPANHPHHHHHSHHLAGSSSSGIWPPSQEKSKKMKRDRSGNATGGGGGGGSGGGDRNVTRIDVYPNGESYVTTPDGMTTRSSAANSNNNGMQSSSAPAPASPIFQFTSNTTAATTSTSGLAGGGGGGGRSHPPGGGLNHGNSAVPPQTATAALNFGKGFAPGAGAQGIAPPSSSSAASLDNNSIDSSSLGMGGNDNPHDTGPLNSSNDGGDSSTTGALVPHWQPQSQTSTCEFTHTISNYSQKRDSGCKKAEYSSITTDSHGNKWRLIIYVNGNGRASNHHLSLFLQVADAEELPFGWNKAVSYVLTLEHPQGQSLGYAKRNPDKTFKLCPKAIDWGWSQFITSDRIQQEGYVNKNTLTVRASVTVKSSSVQIDPEDAELYLKCAVEEGNADAVKICLGQEARVNCQFKDDLYTPLHTACSANNHGDNGNHGSSSSSSTPTNSNSAAPGPISPGSLEVLDLLLERGADVNACNKWRETPLLIAANNGHVEAVKRLLLSGADPSLCSEAGWSALTFAAHKGYEEICGLLLAAQAPVNCRVTEDLSTPLHKACAGSKPGHVSAVQQLLEGNADVHALNKWRETPLLTAANHGQSQAVEALLRYGADPCKCTDTGWSPLSIAAYKGHDEVVRLLLEEGAPTEEDDPTLSALLQAATKGLPDTVMLLLRHGADHTVTTKKGDTALSILVEQNLIDAAVEMVTDYSASIPRCSRDRKKVQRARLLINLRLKQMQREGTGPYCDDSDQGESDDSSSESDDGSYTGGRALHDDAYDGDGGYSGAASPLMSRIKRKKKAKQGQMGVIGHKSIAQAEASARAAEEALLLELEAEEIAKSAKLAAMAETGNSKNSKKKRKKKEKERQLKLAERAREEAAEVQKKVRESKQAKEEVQVTLATQGAIYAGGVKHLSNNMPPSKKEKVVEVTSQTVIHTQKQKKRQDHNPSPATKKGGHSREPPSAQNKKQAVADIKLNLKWADGNNKDTKPKKVREISLPRTDQASSLAKKSTSSTSNNHAHRQKANIHSTKGAGGNKKIPGDNPVLKKIPGDNPVQPKKIPGDNPVVHRRIPGDNPVQPKKVPGDNPKMPMQQQSRAQNTRGSSTPKNKRGWESRASSQQQSSTAPLANQKKQSKQSNKKKGSGIAAAPLAVTSKSPSISSRDSVSPSGKSKPRSDESTHSTANSTADSLPPTPTPQKGALTNNSATSIPSGAAPLEKNSMPSDLSVGPKVSVDDQLANMANDVLGFLDFDSSASAQLKNNEIHQVVDVHDVHGYSGGGQPTSSSITPPPNNTQGAPAPATLPSPSAVATAATASPLVSSISVELPSVSIFRLEKLNELFRQCSEARSNPNNPLRVIDERTLRVVLYRWIIRASHGTESFLDPVIPSWDDEAYLKEFLQRQFISESRRSASSAEDSQQRYNIPSIEVLRDAGAAMSEICTSLAKDVVQFRSKCEQQVPSDWSDTHINVAGMEEGSNVVIDWSGKSRLSIPFVVFNSLARRYIGERSRLMSAVFSAVRRHEIMVAIADQTDMICHLPLQTIECLTKGLGASLETWGDSVSVYGNNYFCAMFPDVDAAFGGLPPFGKEKGGGESVLNRAGGSVIVVMPPENATSSQCIRKMVDMSETSANLPLSFGVVLTSDCFVNASTLLSAEDLRALDPRLCGEKKGFISFMEVIPAGSSIFSKSSSMFLLIQNEAGKIRFPAHPTAIDIIRRSMRSDIGMSTNAPMVSNLPGMQSEVQYDAASFSPVAQPQYTGMSQEVPLSSNPWGPGGGNQGGGNQGGGNRGRGHRGRLFELVGEEEAEEDQGMNNILPGMLDSLNMNMFGNIPNSNDEVDIEAISLMGIGLNGAMNSNYNKS